ncbi:YdcF family protein [Candidatus Pelagibacter sp.]|nr:YdcF family protein [Candidatus Pelagibacter sp.]
MNIYFYFSKILSPFLLFSNLLIILLIVSFIFKKKFKKVFYFFLTIFFLLGLFPIGKFLELEILQKDFYNKKIVNNFDAVLVLGGDESRIMDAINIIKERKNVKLIFAGGNRFLAQDRAKNENNIFKELVKNILVDDEYYILESSRNTIENLAKFKKFNNEMNFKKVVLFTSPYHMKRSLIVSKKMELNLYPYYWKKEWKYNISIINYYQSFSFVKNIRSFDLFFKEILGILSLYLIDFK